MANTPEGYINWEVYEDGTRFCGTTQATLPDVSNITQTISGAGIAGNVESAFTGMVDAMSLTLNFRVPTEDALRLAIPTVHNIDLRVAEQQMNNVTGAKEIIADKYVMQVTPKTTKLGSVSPASTGDASGEYAVSVLKAYKAGKLIMDIEPLNYKCYYNGTDYASPVRKALGLS